MIREIFRFNREALELCENESDATLAEFLEAGNYSTRFIEHYIVPMGAAIWSAAPDRFLEFPAATFIRFFENHGLLKVKPSVAWRVVSEGSRSYVDALLARFSGRVHTNCPVLSLRRITDGIEILLPDGVRQRYDHAIIACHSDQALALMEDASIAETRVLGDIAYQTNETVLHTDPAVMPSRRQAWASWNYRIPIGRQDTVAVTYDMNRLQSITSTRPLLVTLNCERRIASEHVLRRFSYQHPVYNNRTIRAQQQRAVIDGIDRTHFCGAYWGNGFHEDGVNSALAVCQRFGVSF